MVVTVPQTRVDILYSEDFVNLYAKLENENPTGSIKYRVAKHLVDVAERDGFLRPGRNGIVETSSGNTGIALAWLGKERGYPVTIVVPRNCTPQSQAFMKSYGATVIQADGYMTECEEVIRELIERDTRLYWPRQYYNPESVKSSRTLGEELFNQVGWVDYFLACTGTCATITGVGSVIKERNPNARVIPVVPREDWDIPGFDDYRTYPTPLLRSDVIDEPFMIERRDDILQARRKLLEKGHYVGFSSAAAYHVANTLSETVNGNIVIIFADSGNRYPHLLGAE